jgi:uncharacterized OB-fold protein
VKVRFCADCGRLILADFSFCPYCGKGVKAGPGLEEALAPSFSRLEAEGRGASGSGAGSLAETAFSAAAGKLEALEAELGEILAMVELEEGEAAVGAGKGEGRGPGN